MKFEIKVMILPVLISSIALTLTSIDKSFAQRDNVLDTNTIGQDGDDNDASQSDEKSQDSNQNSMCVSGESVSLSCNNLSSESIGSVGQEESSGPEGAFHQVVFSVKPGERNYDPNTLPFDLDLNGVS